MCNEWYIANSWGKEIKIDKGVYLYVLFKFCSCIPSSSNILKHGKRNQIFELMPIIFLIFVQTHSRLHHIHLHRHPWHFSFKLMPLFLQNTAWSHVSPHYKCIKLGFKWGINQHCRIRGCEIQFKFVTKFLEKCY